MNKLLFGLCAAALLVFSGPAHGYITSISGTDIEAGFDAASGELSLSDTINLVVQYDDNTQDSFLNVSFSLTTTLFADNSAGGTAYGVFTGGSFSIIAQDSSDLLSGVVQEFTLEGLQGGTLLGGSGVVTLDTGSLKGDIMPGYDYGDLVSVLFYLDPKSIQDFSGDFSGQALLTILPIPEPATMLLLGLGGCGVLRRKRR